MGSSDRFYTATCPHGHSSEQNTTIAELQRGLAEGWLQFYCDRCHERWAPMPEERWRLRTWLRRAALAAPIPVVTLTAPCARDHLQTYTFRASELLELAAIDELVLSCTVCGTTRHPNARERAALRAQLQRLDGAALASVGSNGRVRSGA